LAGNIYTYGTFQSNTAGWFTVGSLHAYEKWVDGFHQVTGNLPIRGKITFAVVEGHAKMSAAGTTGLTVKIQAHTQQKTNCSLFECLKAANSGDQSGCDQ
jgi:hypothetical protein